jgi:hypothetical protein
MRLLVFTLLAIAVAAGIQCALDALPYPGPGTLYGLIGISNFVLPMLAAAGLAYAMRISNLGYGIFLAILSPFVSWILTIFIAVFVLGQPAYRWIL